MNHVDVLPRVAVQSNPMEQNLQIDWLVLDTLEFELVRCLLYNCAK